MINETYDEEYLALINPKPIEKPKKCDVVIVTFSNEIEEFVKKEYKAEPFNAFRCVNGKSPVYTFEYKGKTFGFYKTLLGAPASVGMIEEVSPMFDSKKYIVFGSAGSLCKEHQGKVIVPSFAYRDEGTSYHYQPADDYICVKNSDRVAQFMEKYKIPHHVGRVWTTDAFFRETKRNYENRKADGCVAVEMECSAMQAVCDFRNLDLYYFLFTGDLLDAPKWDENDLLGANHNFKNFEIALHFANEL